MRLIHDDIWVALTIWQEARGESQDGKIAVGEVIWNRMREHYNGNGTALGTIFAPYQFSGWNTRDRNRVRCASLEDDDPVFLDCREAWKDAKRGTRLTKGALLYYNPNLVVSTPEWVDNCDPTVVIGKHHFYRPKKK